MGYVLNNGCVGILFNDKSKIILSIIGITFFYIDKTGTSTRYTIYEFPETLTKKKTCLDYFIKSIKETKIWKRNQFIQNCELKEPLTFLKSRRFSGVAKMFVLNNSLAQFVFDDQTEVHIYQNTKQIIFIDAKRKRTVFESLKEVQDLDETSAPKKRLAYIKNKFRL